MASYWWTPMIRTAHPVHASNRAHSSLRGIDDDMPQGGFRDLDGADITHLDPVLPAELRPSQPWNMVAATLIRGDTRLSRPCRARRCLERDCARFQDPNRLTEDRWQIKSVFNCGRVDLLLYPSGWPNIKDTSPRWCLVQSSHWDFWSLFTFITWLVCSWYYASYWKQMGFPATFGYMLISILLIREKGHVLQYWTHIVVMIYCFLTTSGNDMPQCGLDDSEGADVA